MSANKNLLILLIVVTMTIIPQVSSSSCDLLNKWESMERKMKSALCSQYTIEVKTEAEHLGLDEAGKTALDTLAKAGGKCSPCQPCQRHECPLVPYCAPCPTPPAPKEKVCKACESTFGSVIGWLWTIASVLVGVFLCAFWFKYRSKCVGGNGDASEDSDPNDVI